ncbi:cytochrome c [Verrucomicrobiaceae bacterium N1E253]|uniref:Cytochrome c n=1 Tax=Oceaniferula marina TaxID=2748318 RepID=A0A851GJ50_9BACT|nr:cytochrome c [Oceaniferula marina]NWK55215.1 cytochrome c [Oceaniferula marina]
MRYFFLAYALIIVMVIGFFGFRGQMFSGTPLRLFPDMDDQDKVKTQTVSNFFADGMSARKPVVGTVPRGFEIDGSGISFGNSTAYSHTGVIGDAYGDGIPFEELGLADIDPQAFLRHGQERFNISCMPCHGESGNGKGAAAVKGNIPATDLTGFAKPTYPDGKMFETITKGKGQMSGYGYNIPVQDRWAIIAYVRALQAARSVPADQ